MIFNAFLLNFYSVMLIYLINNKFIIFFKHLFIYYFFNKIFINCIIEDNGSGFFPNKQSATSMISALQTAVNIIKTSPLSIPNTNFPFYFTPATLHSNQHHTSQVSTKSPQIAPTSVATPFGINVILGSIANADVSRGNFYGNGAIDDFRPNKTPNFKNTIATIESNFGGRRAAADAHAAAILFNDHRGIGCHDNQLGQMKFAGKPLIDLPGRPSIYWQGTLNKDWHEKVGTQG